MKNSVSIILLSKKGNIILQHRDNISSIECPDYWSLIGGWIEDGELPVQAITRELNEEIARIDNKKIVINDIKLLFINNRIDKGWNEYVFYGLFNGYANELLINEGQNIAEFSIAKTLSLIKIAPHHKSYIHKYINSITNKYNNMSKIQNYLELTELNDIKDYQALETGDGYILTSECNTVGVFHTKEDAKIIALLIFVKDVPRGFHYHLEKVEYMTVLSGKLKCEFSLPNSDEKMDIVLKAGQLIKIMPGCIHTFTALENDVYAIEYSPQRYKGSDVIIVNK